MMNLTIPSICGYASRVLMTIVILMLHCESALAWSQYYQLEYVRKDVSATGLRRGTVVGTIYLPSQDLEINTRVSTREPYSGNMVMLAQIAKDTPDPGCRLIYGDDSIGMLRYTDTGTETVCESSKTLTFIVGLTARYTGKTVPLATGVWYVYKVSVPRTKLADVVINDPVKALSHAGQNLTVLPNSLPSIALRFDHGTKDFDFSLPASSLQVHIGETPAAVFFPLQNTSNASLTLPVRPSGGSKSAMASGNASIDLCLYDGAGLSKSRYVLTFQDENATNTSRDFGVYREDGAGKIPYTVSLTDPTGTPQEVYNRESFYWDNMQNGGAAQSRLKYVQLPGIPGTVPCVPSTVTLKVSPVPYNSLMAGRYSGKVSILFTPSTTG